MSKDSKHVRPLVKQWLPAFQSYVKQYGAETVREILTKTRAGRLKLVAPFNKKDRYQMLQLLGLTKAQEKAQVAQWVEMDVKEIERALSGL